MSYYNTTSKKGIALSEAISKAKTQEDKVLTLLEETRDNFTASDAHKALGLNCPLTSIRRALSTLKADECIIMLDITKRGIYGQPEKMYRVHTNEEECGACGCDMTDPDNDPPIYCCNGWECGCGGGPVNDDDKCVNCR